MSDNNEFGSFLIGFVVGGLVGSLTALLLAPQSGAETRTLIKDKSVEYRDLAVAQAEALGAKAGELRDQAVQKVGEVTSDVKSRGQVALESLKKTVSRKGPVESASS